METKYCWCCTYSDQCERQCETKDEQAEEPESEDIMDKLEQIKDEIELVELELERLRQHKLSLERSYWDEWQAQGKLCVQTGRMEY
ncbi:MAG: hypothetical protein ABIG61_07205 [Planctomycetota bacterium]